MSNDPFFDDDEDLPLCDVVGDSGLPCQNNTKPVEIRLNDMVLSKLISQVSSIPHKCLEYLPAKSNISSLSGSLEKHFN
jgi:hypothetical protein